MVEVIWKQDCPDCEVVPGAFLRTAAQEGGFGELYPPPCSLHWGAWGQWPVLSVVFRCGTGLKPLFHRGHN